MSRVIHILLLLSFFVFPTTLSAENGDGLLLGSEGNKNVDLPQIVNDPVWKESYRNRKEHPRITAAILCVALGPFGAHRLYLGTRPLVPAAYTLTLGGGLGVLPVIDLALITFTKDISRFKDNPNVFMWNEKEVINEETNQ